MEEVMAAFRSGLQADSPRAQDLVVRMAAAAAEAVGTRSTAESRARMATGFLMAEQFEREEPEESPRYDTSHGRYVSLVPVINGTPPDTGEFASFAGWLAAALEVSSR